MARRDEYRAELRRLPDERWEGYLAERSGLPGPRANLELVAAVVDEAPAAVIRRLSASEDEFLALCGAAALGRLVVEDHTGGWVSSGGWRRIPAGASVRASPSACSVSEQQTCRGC